jgi:hypothetical protein
MKVANIVRESKEALLPKGPLSDKERKERISIL